MPRQIDPAAREAIVRAFEEDRDYCQVAESLNVKKKTAYNIVSKFQRTGQREALQRGGCRPRLLTEEMVAALISFVEEKPTITLDEMRGKLVERFPDAAVPSTMTISRALDGELVSLKLLRSPTTQWNSQEVKRERKEYMEWLLHNMSLSNLIFMDECGFNIWTARTQGRSFKGQRAVRVVCGQRGRNLTLLLAVSPKFGLVHFTMTEGGMTKDKFGEFLIEVSALLLDEGHITMIFDNAPSHRVLPRLLSEDHEHRRLPRYSPFLNITEMAISCVKSHCKRQLTEPSVQADVGSHALAAAQGKTLHKYRMDLLKTFVESSLPCLTIAKCSNFFDHSLAFSPDCLFERDISA